MLFINFAAKVQKIFGIAKYLQKKLDRYAYLEALEVLEGR